jgi:hypothetical protein
VLFGLFATALAFDEANDCAGDGVGGGDTMSTRARVVGVGDARSASGLCFLIAFILNC